MEAGMLLFLALGVVIALPGINAVPCENDRFDCYATNAACVNGTCSCLGASTGHGLIACLTGDRHSCSLFNDPKGTTLAEEPTLPVKFTYPCRFPITKFRVDRQVNRQQYSCTIRLLASMKRYGGRMFIHGYEALVSSQRTQQTGNVIKGKTTFRVTASANNSVYTFSHESREGFSGSFGNKDPDLLRDELQRMAFGEMEFGRSQLTLNYCGFRVQMRPVDESTPFNINGYMPGLVVHVDGDAFQATEFLTPNTQFCMTPDVTEYNVSQSVIDMDTDIPGSFMTRILKSNVGQNFPGVSSACHGLTRAALDMTDVTAFAEAEQECRFIFDEVPFVKCYSQDEDSNDLVTLYHDCLTVFYGNSITTCDDLWNAIGNRDCVDKVPTSFLCD